MERIALAHAAFQEVKAAFRKQIDSRAEAEELELTPDDCRVVRNNFDYPKFDEYTYPSADLQISAPSTDAIANGDYRWVLAELHPPPALLHHCFYWSCPDRAALSDALASTVHGKPNFHFGFGAADFTAHTTVQIFDALPELTYFVAPQRGRASFQTVAPGETEVYVDDSAATFVCGAAIPKCISVRSRAPGSFRWVFIHFILVARRTCRGCVAAM